METTVAQINRLPETAPETSPIDKMLLQLAGSYTPAQISEFVDHRIGALLRVTGAELASTNSDNNRQTLRFQLTGLSEASRREIANSVETILRDMLNVSETGSAKSRKREKHKVTFIDRPATTDDSEVDASGRATSIGAEIEKSVAAALTHKLNNYLTAIMSATEQLQEFTVAPPESDHAVLTGIILRAANAQRSLVDRFQKVFGPIHIQNEKCNLHQSFRATLGRLQESQHREITYYGESSQTCGITDRTLLEQIVSELVMNAIEATQATPIEFKWQIIRGRLVITVKNGVQESCEELHNRIFEPFFSTKPGHPGLGLNIARRNVEALGGTIRPIMAADQVTLVVSFPIQLEDQTNSHTERNS